MVMKLSAPAKVNLSLRILGKRADGYHNLRSLMAPLSLCDYIQLEIDGGRDGFSFTCSDPTVPCDATNLAMIAAREFCVSAGIRLGGYIHLEKIIPHGAGLGGGSSDAAAVIRGLNALIGSRLATDELESIAARVGSDVPFFIQERSAWITGRGEHVEPCTLPQQFYIVLIKPPFAISTAWAYSMLGGEKQRNAVPICEYGGVEWTNDLEGAIFPKYILLPALMRWLGNQPETRVCRMSGSGSTIFGVCDSKHDSEALAARASACFGETFRILPVQTIG